MTNAAGRRTRLTERGLVRFDVLGRDGDQALIRSVARCLSENGPDADRLREAIRQLMAEKPTQADSAKGALFAALRRSPLVGVELNLTRTRPPDRDTDLSRMVRRAEHKWRRLSPWSRYKLSNKLVVAAIAAVR